MRWFSRRLNAERKERNERKKFETRKRTRSRRKREGDADAEKEEEGSRDFLPNDYLSIPPELHESLDSDPTSRFISFCLLFSDARTSPLDWRSKINARENYEGDDDRICVRFVASRKSFAREDRAKLENRWLEIVD